MLNESSNRRLLEELIKLRRDFHQYPETGWLEYRTSSIIATYLDRLGYEVYVGEDVCLSSSRMGVPSDEILKRNEERAIKQGADPKWIEQMKGGHTGVVGVFKSQLPGPTIALRFDIDALDIQESLSERHLPNKEGFRSKHDDKMHACGHDGHIAIGLGVAQQIMENTEKICGEIRLIFQPAEEGCRGAKAVVDKGWLDNVDYFYGGHIAFQSFTLGEVVAGVGGFLATSKIDVEYFGKAAHAGNNPEKGKNALLAAATASLHLHSIPRNSKGKTRINVGKLTAGTGRNIIPNKAEISIETRGQTTELNEYMAKHAIRIIESAAKTYDVKSKWEIVGHASEEDSNEELVDYIIQEVKNVCGVHTVIPYKDMNASEDVVFMMKRVHEQGGKAAYLLFGSPLAAEHHQPEFDYDEQVLQIGVNVLLQLILSTCKLEG